MTTEQPPEEREMDQRRMQRLARVIGETEEDQGECLEHSGT